MKCNLILHCGASAVSRDVLENVPTPESTASWQPIPHARLVDTVEGRLHTTGFRVVEEAHGVTHDGARYFGLLQIANGHLSDEYGLVLGLRNSHDKKLPAGICAGSQAFVCDNLAFSSEIVIARRHTAFILRDLPMLVGSAIGQLEGAWLRQEERIQGFKAKQLFDRDAHDLTIQALDASVFPGERIAPILREWREPRHDAFKPRTLWSWFNAVTENLKGDSLQAIPRRTQSLYALCESFAQLK